MSISKAAWSAVVGSAVVSLVVSVFGALLHLSANQWFGGDDLPGFVFWTIPFSLFVGSISFSSLTLLKNWPSLLKVLAGILLGIMAGLIWRVFVGLLISLSIRALSVPAHYVWAAGGVCGVLTAFYVSQKEEAVITRPISRSPLITGLLVVAPPAGCIIGTVVLLYLWTLTYDYLTFQPEIYLIPQGYEGPILVIFDQADGQPPKYEGRARVYEIPADGVVRTQLQETRGYHAEFFYVNEKGERTEILDLLGPCTKDLPEDPILVCHSWRGWGPFEYRGFVVGRISKRDALSKAFDQLYETLMPPRK